MINQFSETVKGASHESSVGKHRQEIQILMMDEHPGNDQGQQTRGRRGVMMHGGRVQRQNRGRGRRGQGQRRISDEIRATIVEHVVNHGLQWLRWVSCVCLSNFVFSPLCPYFFFFYHNDVVLSILSSLSINTPHTVVCKFVLLNWIYGIHKKCSLLHFNTVTVIQTVVIVYLRWYWQRALLYWDHD